MDAVQIHLDVTKLDHGIYTLNITCKQQAGILVQLSQAIELFVLEIVHTNIVVITSTKVTCTFVVKVNLHIYTLNVWILWSAAEQVQLPICMY